MYTPRAQIRKGTLRHNYYYYHHHHHIIIIIIVIVIIMVYFYSAYTAPTAIELQSKITSIQARFKT